MAKKRGSKKGGLPDGAKLLLRNKRAYHDYDISETLEAGLVLKGSEVKSLRDARGSIAEAYVILRKGEVWLVGATIKEYPWANQFNHSPTRDRKLLLHREEIHKLGIRVEQRGFTLVPLAIYLHKGKLKLQIGLGKGKKEFEKRDQSRKADDRREIERAMKG
jgi:SsrA-binding protein